MNKLGRKQKFGEATKAIRIPESRVQEVLEYLELVTKEEGEAMLEKLRGKPKQEEKSVQEPQKEEKPQQPKEVNTEKNNSLQKDLLRKKLEDLVLKYKEKINSTSPRWEKAKVILKELDAILAETTT